MRAALDFWRPKPGEKAPDLEALLGAAVEGHGALKRPAAETVAAATAFLADRLAYVLAARGFAADEVAAVVGAPLARALGDPVDAQARVFALQRVRREVPEDFAALAEAFKRAKNILAQAAPAASVDPRLFESDAERALFAAASGLEKAAGLVRGPPAGPRLSPRPGGALLRRRARHGRGRARARQPARTSQSDALALLSHRGHFQSRR